MRKEGKPTRRCISYGCGCVIQSAPFTIYNNCRTILITKLVNVGYGLFSIPYVDNSIEYSHTIAAFSILGHPHVALQWKLALGRKNWTFIGNHISIVLALDALTSWPKDMNLNSSSENIWRNWIMPRLECVNQRTTFFPCALDKSVIHKHKLADWFSLSRYQSLEFGRLSTRNITTFNLYTLGTCSRLCDNA